MFNKYAQMPKNTKSLDVILNDEKAKRKAYQFPEAGKFKREDERFEEISEDEYEKQVLTHDLNRVTGQLYRHASVGEVNKMPMSVN